MSVSLARAGQHVQVSINQNHHVHKQLQVCLSTRQAFLEFLWKCVWWRYVFAAVCGRTRAKRQRRRGTVGDVRPPSIPERRDAKVGEVGVDRALNKRHRVVRTHSLVALHWQRQPVESIIRYDVTCGCRWSGASDNDDMHRGNQAQLLLNPSTKNIAIIERCTIRWDTCFDFGSKF